VSYRGWDFFGAPRAPLPASPLYSCLGKLKWQASKDLSLFLDCKLLKGFRESGFFYAWNAVGPRQYQVHERLQQFFKLKKKIPLSSPSCTLLFFAWTLMAILQPYSEEFL
jgi:hypothetical protein